MQKGMIHDYLKAHSCVLRHIYSHNINWRDVQRRNVEKNVDTSSLRTPWQNGPF